MADHKDDKSEFAREWEAQQHADQTGIRRSELIDERGVPRFREYDTTIDEVTQKEWDRFARDTEIEKADLLIEAHDAGRRAKTEEASWLDKGESDVMRDERAREWAEARTLVEAHETMQHEIAWQSQNLIRLIGRTDTTTSSGLGEVLGCAKNALRAFDRLEVDVSDTAIGLYERSGNPDIRSVIERAKHEVAQEKLLEQKDAAGEGKFTGNPRTNGTREPGGGQER